MRKYIIKRLLQLIPILIGITLLSFILMQTSSMDAIDVMEQNTGGSMSEVEKAAAREELGLDKPLPEQYVVWLKGVLTGDMGKSFVSGQPEAWLVSGYGKHPGMEEYYPANAYPGSCNGGKIHQTGACRSAGGAE